MARDMSTEIPPPQARGLGGLWGSLVQRWPRRLRLGRPRLTRVRLAVLSVAVVLVALWAAVAVTSTSIYSAKVVVVLPGEPVGLPPPSQMDFGELPTGIASEKKIVFENNGRVPTAVMILEWGGIGDLMGISDAFFVIDPGDMKEITFRVEPPPSADTKEYSGKVIVVRVPWWTPW